MPPKRGEDAQSYLKRIQQELKDAKKQALKEQRAKRNELIKKVGKLFVDKCKKDSVTLDKIRLLLAKKKISLLSYERRDICFQEEKSSSFITLSRARYFS